jgi:hypothetical protein
MSDFAAVEWEKIARPYQAIRWAPLRKHKPTKNEEAQRGKEAEERQWKESNFRLSHYEKIETKIIAEE